MCDLLKCNAITTLSPGWPVPALVCEWCSAGTSDWHKSVAHLPSTDPSCFSGSSVCIHVLICQNGQFWLACVHLHLHNENQLTEASLGTVQQFFLQQQRECWISCGLLCVICLPQSAFYRSSKLKRRAQKQFLWEFFWPPIRFAITTEGFPEQPNLECSKGYRCNRVPMR